MKNGAIIALQGVKEEMDTIVAELNRKGLDKPKEFSVLQQYEQLLFPAGVESRI